MIVYITKYAMKKGIYVFNTESLIDMCKVKFIGAKLYFNEYHINIGKIGRRRGWNVVPKYAWTTTLEEAKKSASKIIDKELSYFNEDVVKKIKKIIVSELFRKFDMGYRK